LTKLRRELPTLLRHDNQHPLLSRTPRYEGNLNHPLITVEHVLPQNPKADSQWVGLFDEEQRAQWTHRLGNLVLLNRAKNSAAQNYDFAAKKAKYFTGRGGVVPFALTSQVLQHVEWTPVVLKARQEELLGVLFEEWRL
ncbi:HNH endonuclease family protein, partial [Streptomyces sp. NPDC004542]|uniref:HNH endonuclease family protein n=1 Tax=Streptomyces sp. NPDC004542 TaxID=3154281 RepID=UPI0033AD9F02